MPRIAGVDIPENKKVAYSIQYIYGVGKTNAFEILKEANVNPDKRASQLTSDEVSRIQRSLERFNVEGSLRKLVRDNIQRLRRIGSYRGTRHAQNLPTRGQRTRVNARTNRGKRRTVGAMTKDAMAKTEGK